ncbi:universal stress protein [Jannaschia sp. S6380]|uniref:universal stress protein n=1 Tax=Jannaschia sp. S6380 TaxID=2926408 RepID=UPI001FF636E7|nr:universal stress protein [Jannaschia sp. S6380]MCK0167409.1 universal stress protein [Jannaschia sp. S6380]
MADITLVVGLDGSPAGERVLTFARERASALEACRIIICYVVEWSPWTFQTAEENESRHARRKEEVKTAHERIVDPAVTSMQAEGLTVTGHVAHGDAAEILNRLAHDKGATQIIIGRVGVQGMVERVFGGVSGRLIASAAVPVTIVP